MIVWPFIFVSYLSLFVFGLCDNVRGPLFPEIMRSFGVNDSVGSLMYALSSVSGFISSYIARYLLRRYDRLSVLRGGAACLILSQLGMALSVHFQIFLFCSFVFGLSLGIIGLIPNVLVPLGASSEKKQQFLAGLHAMYGVASLISPILAAAMQSAFGSWRWTFMAITIAPLSLLIYSFHSSHKELHKKNVMSAESRKKHRRASLKPQIYLALMLSFCVSAEIMISSRLALYMQRVWNFDMANASLFVTYFFISMLVGRLLFAVMRLPLKMPHQLAASLFFSFIMTLCGLHFHPIFLALLGFTIAPFYPLTMAWISTLFPQDLDSAVSYMMTMDSVMLVTMHLLVGKLTDQFGISFALHLGPVFLLMSFVLVSLFETIFNSKKLVS